jgi:cyclohexanone monooxygenase
VTPGFYNNEGKSDPKSRYGAFYRGGSIKYWQLLAEWREDGKFEGLEFGA